MNSEKKSVLLISVDGLRPKLVLEAEQYGIELPNIKKHFLQEGAYASAGMKGVFPTFTYPSHQSMITGCYPERHGIMNNMVFDPFGIHQGAWNWFVSEKVATLWNLAKENGYISSSMLFPTSCGAIGDFIVPEFWRDGTILDNKILNVLSTPVGLIKELESFLGAIPSGLSLTLEDDLKRTEAAIWLMNNKLKTACLDKHFFLSVYLASYDETGHIYGVFSEEAKHVLVALDREIGRLISVAESIVNHPVITCLVSDHGLIDNHYNICPNVILKQEGLIEVDPEGKITDWLAYSQRSGGTSEVHLKNTKDESLRLKTLEILNKLKLEPDSGISEILTKDQMIERKGFKDADFAIIAKHGYEIRDNVIGTYLNHSPTQKAQHGYDENYVEMRASFFIRGKGIDKAKDIVALDLIDVAPTLAEIMGFSMPDAQGSSILEKIESRDNV